MNWGAILQGASALGGLTVLAALVTLPWTLRKLRSDTRKTDADAAQVLSNTAIAMLEPANAEIDKLEKRLEKANSRVADLESALGKSQERVHELESEVRQLRSQVSQMSKELTEMTEENSRLRGGDR
ncbi:hypothetical protein C8D88_116153 [Lentzea atacamensis]|uniref:Uncharacterized protein n=1 Tax=Lentzea atacamensis TaxID=531938 RepID=A0A316HKI7_9PSEU|nr:hypothetical protein [Lentzea atacamensis]PWK81741.1 hypothetical protein C8D88_116153 [Lentzea atacamensis]